VQKHVKAYADKGVISRFAIPDRIKFVDAIDSTSVGKIEEGAAREIRGRLAGRKNSGFVSYLIDCLINRSQSDCDASQNDVSSGQTAPRINQRIPGGEKWPTRQSWIFSPTWRNRLGPVEIHREFIRAAARWIFATKL
jgi:hypothetical protein